MLAQMPQICLKMSDARYDRQRYGAAMERRVRRVCCVRAKTANLIPAHYTMWGDPTTVLTLVHDDGSGLTIATGAALAERARQHAAREAGRSSA